MNDGSGAPHKWRPSLWMVVSGAVLAVAVAPLAALYAILFIEWFFDVDFRFHTIWDAGAVLVITVLIGLALSYVASRVLLRPVLHLIERTAEMESGDPDGFRRLPAYGTREMALLADRFVRLARRLSQRNEDLVLFSRHLTHEVKSPVTSILGAVELLQDESGMDPAQRARFLANIAADARRLDDLAGGLRTLAASELTAGEGHVAVCEVATNAVRDLPGLTFDLAGGANLPLTPDKAQIVFRHLAANAREQGARTFRLEARPGRILVGDDAPPIPESDRNRLLQPFFTTRRDEGGTGLGLPIAAAVLERHGAQLEVLDGADGWKFSISWAAEPAQLR